MCRILGIIPATNSNIFKYKFNLLTVNWIQNDLIDNILKLKNRILKIINKKNSSYFSVKNYWIELSNYLFDRSVLNKNF